MSSRYMLLSGTSDSNSEWSTLHAYDPSTHIVTVYFIVSDLPECDNLIDHYLANSIPISIDRLLWRYTHYWSVDWNSYATFQVNSLYTKDKLVTRELTSDEALLYIL